MHNKTLYLVLGVILLGSIGFIVVGRTIQTPEPPRPGIEQSDHGREHTDSTEYGGNQPPTSGSHANPVSWGIYDTEIRDDQAIHNMEHGGVYISYQPNLPQEQVKKLKELLFAPFYNPEFQPKKIVLAPRAENKSPIVLSSWRRSEALANYDQKKIEDYVTSNLGKSPEPLAR